MSSIQDKPHLEEMNEQARKAYVSPTVVYEANLEVRAGTPLGASLPQISPEDLFGTKGD